jgi:hypothetical protein
MFGLLVEMMAKGSSMLVALHLCLAEGLPRHL